MKNNQSLEVAGLALVLFLALSVGSVYANTGEGTIGLPILGTSGVPALAAPTLFSGAFTVIYADGTPVVLESNRVAFDLCNTNSTGVTSLAVANTNANVTTGCVRVTALLRQTSPGAYTYSFTPPSLTGTVTIYVGAYALADDNGRIFPQIDTSIGTYAYSPSTTTVSSVPPSTTAVPAGTPVPPTLSSQAVNSQPTQTTKPTTQTSPIEPLLIVLSTLAVAGSLLTISKRH